MVNFICYLVAFAFFVFGALGVEAKLNWMLAGFAALTLTLVLDAVPK